MGEGFINFQNITKRFGKHTVLDNLNLNISHGGLFGIIGVSGSGKTTLLNILVGYMKPTTGKVTYNAIDIQRNPGIMNQLFGFATQAGSIYPKLTVSENLRYFAKMYNMRKKDIQQRMKEVLRLLELTNAKDVLAEDLSTGMFRRLDIACSIIHKPKVLILDEPTGNIDPVLRKKVMHLIKRITREGTKVIMTSHLLNEAETICDEIAILHNGKIIATGSPQKLKNKYTQNEIIIIETKSKKYEPLLKSINRKGIQHVERREDILYIYTHEAEHILFDLLSAIKKRKEKLVSIEVKKPSMTEVFEELTKKRKNVQPNKSKDKRK